MVIIICLYFWTIKGLLLIKLYNQVDLAKEDKQKLLLFCGHIYTIVLQTYRKLLLFWEALFSKMVLLLRFIVLINVFTLLANDLNKYKGLFANRTFVRTCFDDHQEYHLLILLNLFRILFLSILICSLLCLVLTA